MHQEYDFDKWKRLYEEDPEGYEKMGIAYIHNYIEEKYGKDSDTTKRLKAVLWRVRQEYRSIKDPLVRADRASTAMWKKFTEMNRELNKL